jgi:hypothetical protein
MVNALMAAWFVLLLERYRAGHRAALWLLPLSTALWVNLHSGYFLGLGLVALYLVGELLANGTGLRTARTLSPPRVRGLVLSLGACVAASLLNPNTYKMLWYPFETLGSQAMQRYIQEWAPPDFRQVAYWPSIALLFAGAGSLAYTERQRDLTDVLVFFALGFASLLSARHIPLFAVVGAPILTRYLAQVRIGRLRWDLTDLPPAHPPPTWMVILNWVLVVLFSVVGGLRIADVALRNRDIEARQYPLAALAYIDENGLDAKRMYNSYNWGGYLLWRGYPVFIDGRADVYLDAFMDEYVLAYQLRGDWRRPLDRYDVDYILIERGASFAALLEESDEWRREYADEQAIIFVRVE